MRFDFIFSDTSTTGKSAEYETEESCSKTVVMPQEPVQLEEENSVVILDSGEFKKYYFRLINLKNFKPPLYLILFLDEEEQESASQNLFSQEELPSVVTVEKPVEEILANDQSIYESPEATFTEDKPEETIILDDSITPPDSGEHLSNDVIEESVEKVEIEQELEMQV